MSTRKIFWEDPYRTTLVTTIAAVDGAQVWLASTIFYAFSGGQESDRGTIGGFPVLAATCQGAEVAYTLPPGHTLEVGQSVVVDIDWPRRYRLMRLHFAAELVLELVCRRLPGIEKIGAHIAEERARIDFAHPASLVPILPGIAGEANAIVTADRPIRTGFDDPASGRRYWEIDGFSRVPCGGTHVRSTAEVGPLELRRRNVGKGKERIEITVSPPPGED